MTVGANPEIFCIEIGHDGFNPFTSSKYSVWGVWARCRNVNPCFLASKCNMYPVMLLPPRTDVTSCMELIARDLQRYMPSTKSSMAGEKVTVYDVYHKKEV